MNPPLLQFNDKGIYCAQANVYIDPWRPVKNAIITHGHADHSRWGHQKYITHHTNVPIIKHRLGAISVTGKNWNETFVVNNVKFSLHPAGHIIGSSQVRVEYKGEVWVFTGDYKTEDDGIAIPYEVVKCHTFITECTFGLPVFKWTPQTEVMDSINRWWSDNKAEGKTSILFGYSLGKAQRLLKYLDTNIGKIYSAHTQPMRPHAEALDGGLPHRNAIDAPCCGRGHGQTGPTRGSRRADSQIIKISG